jgi:uncharacterized protein
MKQNGTIRNWLFAQRRRKRAWVLLALTIVLLAFASLNILAYRHARAMMFFADSGQRTASAEKLTAPEKLRVLLSGVTMPKPQSQRTPAAEGLDFTCHTISVNAEVKLEAWHIPNEEATAAILLCHGYNASKSSLINEARVFHDTGLDVFLIDFRGSGGSNQAYTTIGYAEGEDVAASLRFVREQVALATPVILFGQSMGAASILRAVSAHDADPDAIIIESVFDSLLSTTKNRFALMGLPAFPAAHLLVFWGGRQAGFSGFDHNPAEYAASAQCPVLQLHGGKDTRATLEQARHVFDAIPGKKTFIQFSDVGHRAMLRANPEQWTTSVMEFLSEQGMLKTDT